jgi:hypothetical protein
MKHLDDPASNRLRPIDYIKNLYNQNFIKVIETSRLKRDPIERKIGLVLRRNNDIREGGGIKQSATVYSALPGWIASPVARNDEIALKHRGLTGRGLHTLSRILPAAPEARRQSEAENRESRSDSIGTEKAPATLR